MHADKLVMQTIKMMLLCLLVSFYQCVYALPIDKVRHLIANYSSDTLYYNLRITGDRPCRNVGEIAAGKVKEISCENDTHSMYGTYIFEFKAVTNDWISKTRCSGIKFYDVRKDTQLIWNMAQNCIVNVTESELFIKGSRN